MRARLPISTPTLDSCVMGVKLVAGCPNHALHYGRARVIDNETGGGLSPATGEPDNHLKLNKGR